MWSADLPELTDELRQGDLLVGVPFPKRGQVRLESSGLSARVKDANVIVLSGCCTVEQRHSLTIARVIQTKPLAEDDRYALALRNLDPRLGSYSWYTHLLEPHASLPPLEPGRLRVIDLMDTLTLLGADASAFAWLRELRTARMAAASGCVRCRRRTGAGS